MAEAIRRPAWRNAGALLRLAAKEWGQNRAAYLFPLPFLVLAVIYRLSAGHPLSLASGPTIAMLVGAAVLAMVYGLQGFSGEADRQTLDFVLAKPVAPICLVLLKYFLNTAVYAAWLGLFASCLRLELPELPLARGMNANWLLVGLLTLEAMGFLAGLLTRGTERLLATILLTAASCALCYGIWRRVLGLVEVKYFWPDIPPHLYNLVVGFLPFILLCGILFIPPVFCFWLLRGRPNPLRFRPIWRVALVWLGVWLLAEGSRAALGPSLWPLPRDFRFGASGDWHQRAGLVFAGPPTGTRVPLLAVGRLGGRVRTIYRGTWVHTPRWSPDGAAIAFVDNGWIKILRGGKIRRIARGEHPFWAADGGSLLYAETAGRDRHATGFYRYLLATGRKTAVLRQESRLVGLAWDSRRGRLYLFERDGTLKDVDLQSGKIRSSKIGGPLRLTVENPWGTVGPDGTLYLTLAYDGEAHVHTYSPASRNLYETDKCAGRVLPSLPVLALPGQGYLWGRTDLVYEFRGYPALEHEQIHGHGSGSGQSAEEDHGHGHEQEHGDKHEEDHAY